MTADPKPDSRPRQPRRWRQFSLRSLMVLMLLCCIGLAWWTIYVEPYRRQQRLAAQVADLGGTVTREPVPTLWSALFGDEFFFDLVGLHVHGAPLGDTWLANLRDTPRLRELNLGETSVTDAGLISLTGLTRLQRLQLNGLAISDAGLAHLAGLTDLQFLDLRNMRVTDEGVVQLAGLTKLVDIRLDNTDVTEASLARLKKLPALESVSATGTHIIPPALREAFPGMDTQRLARTLAELTAAEFVLTPLGDVAEYFTDYHRTQVLLDRRSLDTAGRDAHTSVTLRTRFLTVTEQGLWRTDDRSKPLGETLRGLLEPLGLKYVVRHGVLMITAKEDRDDARRRLVLKPGEKLSRSFSQALYAVESVEFVEFPLSRLLAPLTKSGVPIRAAEPLDARSAYLPLGLSSGPFSGPAFPYNGRIPTADTLEILFHELDLHGVIEDDTVHVYRGPIPDSYWQAGETAGR